MARVALDDEQENGGEGEPVNQIARWGRARKHNYVQGTPTYIHIYIRERRRHTHVYYASQKRNTGYIKVCNLSVLAFLFFFLDVFSSYLKCSQVFDSDLCQPPQITRHARGMSRRRRRRRQTGSST